MGFYAIKKGVFLSLLTMPLWALSQKNKEARKYEEEAASIRKEVWAWDDTAFNRRTIPERYANRSTVILARRIEINADGKKWSRIGGSAALTQTQTVRELIKINDKAAVSDYSALSYKQFDKTRMQNKGIATREFIGIRVIKPDGSIKEIQADDIILTKDEKKEREAKVAIPDLMVGDLIDYFISSQVDMLRVLPPLFFPMYDESPMLHYSIHCEIGKKYGVIYRCYNKAPDFKQSVNEDGDIVLDLEKDNIPALPENTIWYSALRQLPVVRMQTISAADLARYNADDYMRRTGPVYGNVDAAKTIDNEINLIAFNKRGAVISGLPAPFRKTAAEYLKNLKNDKTLSADSLAAAIFYAYRFDQFLDIDATADIGKVIGFSERPINPSTFLFYLNLVYAGNNIPSKMILLTSKYGPDMKSLMGPNDIDYMLEVNGAHPALYGVSDVFSPAAFVPSSFESAKGAVTLDTKERNDFIPKVFERGTMDIEASPAENNAHIEQLEITPLFEQNGVAIKRSTILKGQFKQEEQSDLILFEDYYESERKMLGQEKSLIEKLKENPKSRKYAEELKAAFDQARKNQKNKFIAEAKNWLELDIADMKNFQIDNLGVRHTSPDFVYSSEFLVPGVIKNAGSNFMIDIGKFQGAPLKLASGQRKRFLDVYAPYARSLRYEIRINIPEGYSAEGVEALNKKVENECALFSCQASSNGKTVSITINKLYKNSFEPAANWNKILDVVDASNEWSNAKLLFKKL